MGRYGVSIRVDWAMGGSPSNTAITDVAITARTSRSGEDYWDAADTPRGDRVEFVKKLIAKGHTSVIETVVFGFVVRASRIYTHEQVRHRIASYTQQTTRVGREITADDYIDYSSMIPGMFLEDWISDIRHNAEVYNKWLARVGPELARRHLNHAISSRIRVTMNARSLRNFFTLRLAKDADFEIRNVAEQMLQLIAGAGYLFLFSDIPVVEETVQRWSE